MKKVNEVMGTLHEAQAENCYFGCFQWEMRLVS